MKKLVLITPVSAQQDLADCLRSFPQIGGFTFTPVEGYGMHNPGLSLSARDRVVGYVPHVRVDALLADEDVEAVLKALGAIGNGQYSYWMSSVERHGRL